MSLFKEWITQNKEREFNNLVTNKDLGMETQEQEGLIESQLDQWVDRLMGLLHTLPQNRKQKLLEKVISDIKNFKAS